jgi:TolA-binding protein
MLKSLILGKTNLKSRILTAKVFYVAIIVSIFSTACMAPRPHSIRRADRNEVVTKSAEIREVERKKESEIDSSDDKLDPQEYMRLLDEADAQMSSNAPKQLQEKAEPVLKPLDEQIALLEKRQNKSEADILAINQKIKSLESSIDRLNSLIDNISSHLPPPSVGPKNDNPEITDNIEKEDEAEFVIMSDEEVSEKKENKKIDYEAQKELSKVENEPKRETNNLIPESTPSEEIDKLNELSFSLAEAYLEKDDYGKAIKKLQEIENRIEEVTGKSKVSMMLGESHFGLKQYSKAINYFIKVLEMPEFGTHDKARMMIADSHIAQGETDKAKNYYKDLVSENPKSNYIPKAKMMLQRL